MKAFLVIVGRCWRKPAEAHHMVVHVVLIHESVRGAFSKDKAKGGPRFRHWSTFLADRAREMPVCNGPLLAVSVLTLIAEQEYALAHKRRRVLLLCIAPQVVRQLAPGLERLLPPLRFEPLRRSRDRMLPLALPPAG